LASLLNLLYATTAGIAANRPSAVANKASAIPGATIARLVFQDAMEGLLKKKSRTNIGERMSASLEAGIEKQMTKIEKVLLFWQQ